MSSSIRLLNVGCGRHFHSAWINIDLKPVDERVNRCDALACLPFDDDSFDAVYHSHVLEHMPVWAAPAFLTECYRVLAPGGVIRVVVPDLEAICRLYIRFLDSALAGDSGAADRYDWMMMELLDQMVREESGGEMLRFWKKRPVPAEDFVVERVGRIAKQFIDDHARKPLPQTAEVRRELQPEDIGAFRMSGEVHKWMYDRFSLARLLTAQGFTGVRVCHAEESAIPDYAAYGLDVEDGQIRKPDSLFMEAQKPR